MYPSCVVSVVISNDVPSPIYFTVYSYTSVLNSGSILALLTSNFKSPLPVLVVSLFCSFCISPLVIFNVYVFTVPSSAVTFTFIVLFPSFKVTFPVPSIVAFKFCACA